MFDLMQLQKSLFALFVHSHKNTWPLPLPLSKHMSWQPFEQKVRFKCCGYDDSMLLLSLLYSLCHHERTATAAWDQLQRNLEPLPISLPLQMQFTHPP